MFNEENYLRMKIADLSEDLLMHTKLKDWDKCDLIDLEIEDLTQKLQLIARPKYYKQEKI